MERFAVKRGVEKTIGGSAGLAKLATEYFEEIQVDANGVFKGSFGLMTHVSGYFDEKGRLAVEVEQLKGEELTTFLSQENGRELAMESRRRWSSFLDTATGYNAKQRGDKAKEEAKKFAKAKSAISMAHKSMELMSNVSEETKSTALNMIADFEAMIDEGNAPTETQVKKLNDLF